MIQRLSRRFEMVDEIRTAPSGTVDWTTYATEMVPAMKLLSVPCRHPDLVSNRELRAAIHFTLRKQLCSLETQRDAGGVVFELMQICMNLLRAVDDIAPRAPSPRQLEMWLRTPLATAPFFEGLNAIRWTTDETGLGGMTDWRGLPWAMSMEQFYEAWVETVFGRFTRRFGGLLKVGRRRETITPIAWERAYLGSQKFLLPDLVIEQEDRIIYVDAKYKDHWDQLRLHRWMDLETEIRERHRDDLLQVLAYSTLSDAKSTTACLAFPCTIETWNALKSRGQLSHRGAIYAGKRKIQLVLAAVPMGAAVDELVAHLGLALAE
jgi:5-methylcytosine-specific restriction endonuclease McrBC regulatory subunit McrC